VQKFNERESNQMTKSQKYQTIFAKSVGPRVVGGVYFDSYWGSEYTVDAIDVDASGWMRSITVTDSEGTRSHCTCWDRRDRVISQPYAMFTESV
jgi:hypothetical protein